MRISDWSSDVCSSDLYDQALEVRAALGLYCPHRLDELFGGAFAEAGDADIADIPFQMPANGVDMDDLAGQGEVERQPAFAPDRQGDVAAGGAAQFQRSEEHTSALQSLMRISYAVFFLKKQTIITVHT